MEIEKNTTIDVLELQELERKRISMELHDTTVQNLTNLIYKTELVMKLMDIDLIHAKLELGTMNEIIRKSINELREIIYELRPMEIEDLGLMPSLEQYINQVKSENNSFNINLNIINKENPNILPIVNLTLLRVIQEALSNVIKHSKGNKVDIVFNYKRNEIEVEIIDDGVGFILDKPEKEKKHYGLSIMKERVSLLSGIMNIESNPGRGTKVLIKIPIIERE